MNRILTIPEEHIPAIARALEIRLHVLASYKQVIERETAMAALADLALQREACASLLGKLKGFR